MMQVVFLDLVGWDYDVTTPLSRPLGGSQSALCYLAAELARRGHRVHLVNGIPEAGMAGGVAHWNLRQVPGDFFKQAIDAVIVLNGPAQVGLDVRPHLIPGTPLVLWTQHAADQPAMQPLAQPEVRAGWSAIVCVSDWQRRTLIERFSLNPERVVVLRNAIAPTFENLFTDPEALVEAKSGPATLAYTSTPFRGLDVLLNVFPRARASFPDLELTVYSSMQVYQVGSDNDPYAALYTQCRTLPGVHYPGSVAQTQLAAALRSTTLLAYPNTFAETSCIAVMEAMAAGLAVVTTDLGALPETTLGYASLVPPVQDARAFGTAYLERLSAVLRYRATDPAGFARRLFDQVRAVNDSGTWRVRADEWERTIQTWKEVQATQTDMTIDQALALARTHLQQGTLDKAEALCRLVLESFPQHALALHLLGLVALQAGQPEPAVALLQQSLALEPASAEFAQNLRAVLQSLGRADEAAQVAVPNAAVPALLQQGQQALAEQRFPDAVTAFQQALQAEPNQPLVANNLGFAWQAQGRLDEAEAAYQQATELKADYAAGWYNLGTVRQQRGQLEGACQALQRALRIQPDHPEAANNLGNALNGLGRAEEAVTAYRQALQARPDFVEVLNNLGTTLQGLGRLSEAEAILLQAVRLQPQLAELHTNLGNLYLKSGQLAEARARLAQACTLDPTSAVAHSNFLLGEHYQLDVTPAGLAKLHADWDERHGAPLRSRWHPFTNDRDPERPLRIGFVSADFGVHPVGFFLVRLLEALDLQQCDTCAYSNRPAADALTQRLRDAVTVWTDVVHLNDTQLAEQIRSDSIDLLIDLSGHTARNRLRTFAQKPAPLQLTWLGYVGTTGLAAMDYLIADRWQVPPGREGAYREQVLRLPDGYLCYAPPADAPAIGPPPAKQRGYVTFGSFSNPAKINPEVVKLWAAILQGVAQARLLLIYAGFGDDATRGRLLDQFAACGIAADRLELHGHLPHTQLLARYNDVDIALDTFPYAGGLTTCEALWMGVPVVTCPGDTFASRHALSHLSNVGLAEMIAKDRADYVAKAIALAKDLSQRTLLRRTLRDRMMRSPLCDAARFARNFLAAVRDLWRQWCRANPGPVGGGESARPSLAPPSAAEHEFQWCLELQSQGRWAESEEAARRVLAAQPQHGDAWNNLGLALQFQQRFAEAIDAYRQALALKPGLFDAANNSGLALVKLGRRDEAERAYQQALTIRPEYPQALYNLGNLFRDLGQLREAEAKYREALALQPSMALGHNNLGRVLKEQGRLQDAEASYREALVHDPNLPEAHNNLGNLMHTFYKPAEAEACYRQALALRPGLVEAANNLCSVLQDRGQYTEAVEVARRTLVLRPQFAELQANLGNALQAQGNLEEAFAIFQRALELDPHQAAASTNLLKCAQHLPGMTAARLAELHAAWERVHGEPWRSRWRAWPNTPDPERPLRLGLVSADFGNHPVGYFLVRVLEALDREQCAVVCYSNRPNHDPLTDRIAAAATLWRPLHGSTDEALAEQIRADGIDLLFDLAGHTGGNRLLTFARKPAPIQLTWLGYVGTTGLGAMDYLIADRFHVPAGEEMHYRETVLRLPDDYLCFDPPVEAPEPGPLPALHNGYVTFGSFNNPMKLTAPVIALWAKLLRQVPGSRLILQFLGFEDPGTCQSFRDRFSSHGIDGRRLDFHGWTARPNLLARYRDVDLALDPFPYSGGLTTLEALWMGVPVVTCPGETFASRHAYSHLSNVGLTETIARDHADYLAKATALAKDLPRLEALRHGLRERMAQSPVCDGPRFARNFLAVLREVWRAWCRSR